MEIKLSPKLNSLLSAAKEKKAEFLKYHEEKPWNYPEALRAFHEYIWARNELDKELNGKLTVEQLGG